MPVLSGVVKDSSGALASRIVRAYRRDTGAFVGQALSDPTTGAYSITTATTAEHFVLAHDTATFADPYWGSVVLACHFDGANGSTSFVDEKGHTLTANGNAQISTAQSKFGGSSGYFDGTGDYVLVTDSADFDLPGDFTIDAWVRTETLSAGAARGFLTLEGNDWEMLLSGTNQGANANKLSLYKGSYSIFSPVISAQTFYHFALVRSGTTVSMYLDGVLCGSVTSSTSIAPTGIYLGSYSASHEFWYGYVDDLRITKAARWTTNFTPPTSAFLGGITGGTENAVILDRVVPV